MKTYPCPTCGRKGYCRECCCIHRAHHLDMRFEICPLCKHRLKESA